MHVEMIRARLAEVATKLESPEGCKHGSAIIREAIVMLGHYKQLLRLVEPRTIQ